MVELYLNVIISMPNGSRLVFHQMFHLVDKGGNRRIFVKRRPRSRQNMRLWQASIDNDMRHKCEYSLFPLLHVDIFL